MRWIPILSLGLILGLPGVRDRVAGGQRSSELAQCRLHLLEHLQVIADLPQHQVGIAPRAGQAVGTQEQLGTETQERRGELYFLTDLLVRLEPAPRGFEL